MIQYLVFTHDTNSEERYDMPISENAKAVLERRYLARDEQGNPTETVDGLFRRVANAVGEGDRHFDPKADRVATAVEF